VKRAKRPAMPPVSEQMKAWSSALEAEIGGWPHASTRSFFGFTALYRKDKIFGMLPRTRAWETGSSIVFKMEPLTPAVRARLEKDERIGFALMGKTPWLTFELSSDADLHGALDCLGQAYESAGKRKKSS